MKTAEIIKLLEDIELLIRVNAPMTDGSAIHKAVKSAIAKLEKVKK